MSVIMERDTRGLAVTCRSGASRKRLSRCDLHRTASCHALEIREQA